MTYKSHPPAPSWAKSRANYEFRTIKRGNSFVGELRKYGDGRVVFWYAPKHSDIDERARVFRIPKDIEMHITALWKCTHIGFMISMHKSRKLDRKHVAETHLTSFQTYKDNRTVNGFFYEIGFDHFESEFLMTKEERFILEIKV